MWSRFFPTYVNSFAMGRGRWSPVDYWDCLQRTMSKRELSRAVNFLWCTWSLRNSIRFDNLVLNEESLLLAYGRVLDLDAPSVGAISPPQSSGVTQVSPSHLGAHSVLPRPVPSGSGCGKPTCLGRWKLNSDASWLPSRNRGGLGCVVRDELGFSVIGGCKVISHKWPIKVLEAADVVEGLESLCSVQRFCNSPVEVELDTLEVVALLNQTESDLSEVGLFIEEALALALGANVVSFCKIPREDNIVAHNLAYLASFSGVSLVWKEGFSASAVSSILEMV